MSTEQVEVHAVRGHMARVITQLRDACDQPNGSLGLETLEDLSDDFRRGKALLDRLYETRTGCMARRNVKAEKRVKVARPAAPPVQGPGLQRLVMQNGMPCMVPLEEGGKPGARTKPMMRGKKRVQFAVTDGTARNAAAVCRGILKASGK